MKLNFQLSDHLLPRHFAAICAVVKGYVGSRCFGRVVDLEAVPIRFHLSRLEIQEGIPRYLARVISELTVERRTIAFGNADFRLSETQHFG
jgi:hypothetical protein